MGGRTAAVIFLSVLSACAGPPEPAPANATPSASPLTEIPVATDRVGVHMGDIGSGKHDLDGIVERGSLGVVIAPSQTYIRDAPGRLHGKAVDVAVALAAALSQRSGRYIGVDFFMKGDEELIPYLLAGGADIAANVRLTFARDEQVAFAPPIRTGIREFVVTRFDEPLVSLEDVGGRVIHVRKNSDHHLSLLRLNEQLVKINRPPARIVADENARTVADLTDEGLIDRVNDGRIPATLADDYIYDRWKKGLSFDRITVNRDVAVSQDSSISWVTRKDAPNWTAFVKEFFSTHKLTF